MTNQVISSSKNRHVPLIIILLLGFALRVYGLGEIGVNNDEALDYHRLVGESFRAIVIGDLRLNNQVLAHILARSSLLLLGDTLFALRWPSLCISMLGIGIIYKLAQLLLGRPVGLVSALLLAISPYSIFFAHSFRGYSGVIVLPILVGLLALLALRYNRRRYRIGLVLAAAAMMYTHLFTVFALLNLILFMAGIGWYGYRSGSPKQLPWRRWVGAVSITIILLCILYAPVWARLIRVALGSSQEPLSTLLWAQRPEVPASIWYNLWLFNGFWQHGSQSGHGVYVLLVLLIGAVALSLAGQYRFKIWLLMGWAILPFFEIGFVQRIANGFWARAPYLSYTLPPLLILAALVIMRLPTLPIFRRLSPAPLITLPIFLFGLFWYPALTEYYRDFAGADWQSIGNFLQKNSTAADLVVCQRYNHGWRDVDVDQEDLCTRTLNYRREADTAMTTPVLSGHDLVYGFLPGANAGVINRQGRIWLIVWDVPPSANLTPLSAMTQAKFDRFGLSVVLLADRQATYGTNLAEALAAVLTTTGVPDQQYIYNLMIAPLAAAGGQAELAQQALDAARRSQPNHADAAAKLTATEQLMASLSGPVIEHRIQANFGQEVMLQGYNLAPPSARPGRPLKLTLFWQAMQVMQEDYAIFLHVRDQAGHTVAQFDYQPFNGEYPTQHWQIGQLLPEVREFDLPRDFPPGQYNLMIGLYNPETLERVTLLNDQSGENALLLTSLTVE